jgi:CDP-diacylglycerol---glycerol-3-phosphate 3-phosphatidyltransferase
MNADLLCSIVVLGTAMPFALRWALLGARSGAPVDDWGLRPFVDALVARRVAPNVITGAGLALAIAAGLAICDGHLGLAGALLVLGSVADALDGAVARARGVASRPGALFDASSDRYQEFAVLGGLAMLFHDRPALLAGALFAMLGAFMVSYGSAKAEAFGVAVPGGAMRRAARAVVLCAGVVLTPLSTELARRAALPEAARELPIWFAVWAIAVVANVSAVRRLRAIGHVPRARAPSVLRPAPRPVAPAEVDAAE